MYKDINNCVVRCAFEVTTRSVYVCSYVVALGRKHVVEGHHIHTIGDSTFTVTSGCSD